MTTANDELAKGLTALLLEVDPRIVEDITRLANAAIQEGRAEILDDAQKSLDGLKNGAPPSRHTPKYVEGWSEFYCYMTDCVKLQREKEEKRNARPCAQCGGGKVVREEGREIPCPNCSW